MLFLTALLGFMSLGAQASTEVAQANTSISFTRTTTTNYQITTSGNLHVALNSVQLTNPPPQAYSFEVFAQTYPGLWITRIIWNFGDGEGRDVPYCCQNTVSEVQYHAYPSHPDTLTRNYTVTVFVFDNMGNFGDAEVTVNWVTPIPEYPAYAMPLIASLLAAFFGVISIKKRLKH